MLCFVNHNLIIETTYIDINVNENYLKYFELKDQGSDALNDIVSSLFL